MLCHETSHGFAVGSAAWATTRDSRSLHGQAGRARSSSSPGKCLFRYHELGPQQVLSFQLKGALCFLDHLLDDTPRESLRLARRGVLRHVRDRGAQHRVKTYAS
jgi:hypothetical protein